MLAASVSLGPRGAGSELSLFLRGLHRGSALPANRAQKAPAFRIQQTLTLAILTPDSSTTSYVTLKVPLPPESRSKPGSKIAHTSFGLANSTALAQRPSLPSCHLPEAANGRSLRGRLQMTWALIPASSGASMNSQGPSPQQSLPLRPPIQGWDTPTVCSPPRSDDPGPLGLWLLSQVR